MLVSHRKRFIYTKTKKTAGTSVELYFEPYCMQEGEWFFSHEREEYVSDAGIVGSRCQGVQGLWYNHMAAEQIRNQLGADRWNQYFKFCVIRNPFDRLISAFHHAEFRKENAIATTGEPSKRWFKKIKGQTPQERFREWVGLGKFVSDRDKYTINGDLCVDYLIRYEDLEGGIRHVCEVLDIPFDAERIPRLKTGIRPPGQTIEAYYDAATIERVAHHYAFEIAAFGYQIPKPADV